jgi:hypothetical protein
MVWNRLAIGKKKSRGKQKIPARQFRHNPQTSPNRRRLLAG